jgi:hypothetical protein
MQAFAGFLQDKMTRDGTNNTAISKDAMWDDQVKDDGVAKGATKKG